MPHFDVLAVDEQRLRHRELWQHWNLVFVSGQPTRHQEQ
jgi:hypothetical protein